MSPGLAGELAAGTITYLAGPKTLADFIVPTITAAAVRAGRTLPRIVAGVPVVVTDKPSYVRERARLELGYLARLPGYQAVLAREGVSHPSDLVITGDERQVASQIERYWSAGATDLMATDTGLGNDEDRERTWRVTRTVGLRRAMK